MGKSKTAPATELIELNHEAVREDATQADQAILAERMTMDFEEVHRQIGQLDAFEFTKRVSDVAAAQIFENIKNSRKYKGLPYTDADGNRKYISTLEELCEVKFGKTARRMLDLSQNLRLLGPELYEQSERLGLRNVDYKALRALPDDDQILIKRALEESATRDQVIDLMQEMAVKHAQARAAHEEALAEEKAESEGKDRLLAQKTQRINELVAEKNRADALTADERATELETALTQVTLEAVGHLLAVKNRIHDIRALDDLPQGLYTACGNALQRLVSEIMGIALDYGIELHLAAELPPEFADPNAGEDGVGDWKART
ncbi:MAG: hypothetical protein U1E96_08835 [Azonexus sp.]